MSRVITPGIFVILNLKTMTELFKTRFFALLAGESQEEITKECLEEELGKFVEEVAGLCDLGDDYWATCRTLNYTKARLQVLSEMYRDCDGVGEKRCVAVMFYRARIASG